MGYGSNMCSHERCDPTGCDGAGAPGMGADGAGDATTVPGLRIDCDDCVMQHTSACDDCIVTALIDRRDDAVVLDLAEARAVRALQRAGLAPRSRFLPIADGRGA